MSLDEITSIIDNKILKNENIIKFTFYELRVKLNLSEDEMFSFLHLARNRLSNSNYTIYTTNQQYKYNNVIKIVKENEMLIAIKN